jgi:hypothetical protein
MITALVKIRLPQAITLEAAKAVFLGTAPKYRNFRGLIRKYYLLSEDGKTAGGVYLWETRTAAQSMYDEDWHAFIREKYGVDPEVTYFQSPVVVDNLADEIIEG